MHKTKRSSPAKHDSDSDRQGLMALFGEALVVAAFGIGSYLGFCFGLIFMGVGVGFITLILAANVLADITQFFNRGRK